ncbi:MAG: LPP20 family lipoprotein [Verrucomicrobiae bacterium]|nr:LPP20 family lipoprotein [Verrucomicrobiae bacterium]
MNLSSRIIAWSLGLWVSAAMVPAWAQLHPGQEKLLAKEAARKDAQRNLLEQIKGLKIDAATTVRDFVTQSDQINTAMMEHLRGARVVPGSETWDGEVYKMEMEVTLQQVKAAIEQIQRTYPSGRTYVTENMTTLNQEVTIRAQGQGTTRGASMPGAAAPAQAAPSYGGVAAIVTRQVPPGWENVTAQGRLLAERAARVDAMRKLAERIRGIRIDANTTVRDFVTQADVINGRLESYMKGARQVGPTRFLPDQTCEVDLEVTIQDVVKWLQEIQEWVVHPPTPFNPPLAYPIRTYRMERIMDFGPPREIRETGSGTVRGDTIRAPAAPSGSSVAPPPTQAGVPAWATGVVSAKGSGVPKEGETGTAAKLNAERAAEVDARRNLLEKVNGVQIDAQTTVKDFVTQNDQVRARVLSVLQGADVSDPKYLEDGSVEVVASIPLEKIYRVMQEAGAVAGASGQSAAR